MDLFDELLERQKEEDRINGVLTGIVKENWDDKHQGQIKVEYFLGEKGKSVGGWVPVAMPYTASGAGMYFLPEIGTEVVIAFVMGDRRCPIVIGSLWNQTTKLPEKTAEQKNTVKKIRTKAGHEILFGGEASKEFLEIRTPKELTLRMDDEKKTIAVSDKDGKNKITIDCDKGALTLDCKSTMELKVGGKSLVKLEKDKVTVSGGSISVKADQALKLKAQTMNLESAQLELKASASAKIDASGLLQVKGAMIKLN